MLGGEIGRFLGDCPGFDRANILSAVRPPGRDQDGSAGAAAVSALAAGRCRGILTVDRCPVRLHECLERPDLGVGFVGGSNNSCRTLVPVVGGCIRLAGAGCNLGHTGGAGPTLAQPEIASTQASNSAISSLLRM